MEGKVFSPVNQQRDTVVDVNLLRNKRKGKQEQIALAERVELTHASNTFVGLLKKVCRNLHCKECIVKLKGCHRMGSNRLGYHIGHRYGIVKTYGQFPGGIGLQQLLQQVFGNEVHT